MPYRTKALEDLRLKAAGMFAKNRPIAEIVRVVGRSHWVVYGWRRKWRQGGEAALRRKAGNGKSLELGARQWSRLSLALEGKPAAVGGRAPSWSLSEFADYVEKVAGRPCNRYMARRILESLGYRYILPPAPTGYHQRHGAGSWTKLYSSTIPGHLLPSEHRVR